MKQALASQRMLAKAVGVTPQAVSKWVLGLSAPSEEHAGSVREFLVARARRFRRARAVVRAALQEEI